MENSERLRKINELNSKIRISQEEIKLKNLEQSSLRQELFDLEWPIMKWDELTIWLKENRPENDYQKNPTVISLDGHNIDYCKLTEDGELQIGPYFHRDHFPRGTSVRVSYDFKSWR